MNNKLKIEKEEYITKTFRLNRKIVDAIHLLCNEKGISTNKFLDLCIRYSLKHLDSDSSKNPEQDNPLN